MRIRKFTIPLVFSSLVAAGTQALSQARHQDMPAMNMSEHSDAADFHDNSSMSGGDSAMRAMESHHMNMGPHMKMTSVAGACAKLASETCFPSTLGKEKSGAFVPSGSIVLGVNTMESSS